MKGHFGVLLFVYPALFVFIVTHLWTFTYIKHDVSILGKPRTDCYMSRHINVDGGYTTNSTTETITTHVQSPNSTEEHVLTLFTTFNSSMENFYIYNNTLHGWMLMKPEVVLVFFSDDAKLSAYVKNIGWDLTLNVGLKACNGTPVLKDMFLTVQRLVKSKFYAYANADILFNRGLFQTLSGVMKNAKLYNSPLLLTGKRSDLQLDNNKITNIRGEREIDIAFKMSHMSYGYAEDYFVVNNKFPWKIYPNLVIGRAMVDNYLAYVSRTSKVNVIDTSATVGALHQKTKSRKRKSSNCNKEILGKLWAKHKIQRGNVECFPWETRFDIDGSVFVMRRGTFTYYC